MGIINQLDFQTANLIAAGEVVDRPASACKELLENSIDAGASVVTIEIKNGGVSFIRVSDNGKGMERDDVPIAIKRHATSKIKTAADLSAIMTLGFRGEALAAISSVSHMRILTKRREDTVGTKLECEPGKEPMLSEIAISDGTTVIVENLFENVPARRKFLKKDQTEAMAVTANIEKVALSNPQISVRLIIDGQTKFVTAGDGILKNTIYALLGRDFANRMIPIDRNSDGVHIHGFVGTPDNIRANRNYQNFFINNRYVKSKCAQAALEQAFTSYSPSDRFPVCVLFIDIAPQTVDVNVHPAKLEVKFSNEKLIFESVYYAVRGALESNISRPELSMPGQKLSDGAERKQLNLSNAFVPLNDSHDRAPKSPYLNQKNVQRGQISIDDQPQDGNLQIDSPAAKPAVRDPGELKLAEKALERIFSIGSEAQTAPRRTDEPSVQSPRAELPEIDKNQRPIELESLGAGGTAFSAELPPDEDDSLPPEIAAITGHPRPERPERRQTSKQSPRAAEEKLRVPAETEIAEAPAPLPEAQKQSASPIFSSVPPKYRIIGEAFYSYVFVEQGDKVLIIDKHAAHERIIFEELRQNLAERTVVSQLMLVPLEVDMTPGELQAIEDHKSEIAGIGFEFTIIPPHKLSVSGIPQQIEPDAAPSVLETLAGQLASGTGSTEISNQLLFEKALYQASCKAAIKAGHSEDSEHIKWICDRLLSLNDIKFCPHGRPVAFEISKANIERQFKRT